MVSKTRSEATMFCLPSTFFSNVNLRIQNIVQGYNLLTLYTLGVKGAGCKLFLNSLSLVKKN